MGWFDRPEKGVGSLCTQLSDDGTSVQGAIVRMGLMIEVIFSLGLSIGLFIFIAWRLGLLTNVFVPGILFSTFLQANISSGRNVSQMRALEKSAGLAMETMSNIRTVKSLCSEDVFYSTLVFLRILTSHS